MKRSMEDRREWGRKMKALEKEIETLSETELHEQAERLGIVRTNGVPLSPKNMALLAAQTEIACSIVGGFQQWRAEDRRVPKGQSATGYIFAPTEKRNRKTGERERRFQLVPIWDISVTVPAEAGSETEDHAAKMEAIRAMAEG